MAYFKTLIINGEPCDLSHLEPICIFVDSEKAGKKLEIDVRFSTHCFTEGYDGVSDTNGYPILKDGKRDRIFCPTRYRLSKKLRPLIEGFQPATHVIQTAEKRNWSYSMTIMDPAGPYHVFFTLKRNRDSQYPHDLSMFVESAYHQDPAKKLPALLGKMRFGLLCGKVYKGEPVSTKR